MPLRLFCLPYAGASAMIYARWRRLVPAWLSVSPLELPGRGRRFAEPAVTDADALSRQLAGEIAAAIDGPYALFGHSLGAILALELAHRLRDRGLHAPSALIVSGSDAPSRGRLDRGAARGTSDAELMDELRRLGGTAPELLADAELMEMTLPLLRADFQLYARYQYRRRPALACPVHVLSGRSDAPTETSLAGWGDETAAPCTVDLFDGDHFFLHPRESDVVAALVRHLARAAPVAAA